MMASHDYLKLVSSTAWKVISVCVIYNNFYAPLLNIEWSAKNKSESERDLVLSLKHGIISSCLLFWPN